MKKLLGVISIVLIAFFFVFGVYNYRGKHSNFRSDGYVIDTKTNNKQYFSDNGEYKVYDSSNSVTFTNSDNETQNVSNDTFIHYSDGSISAFKKTSAVSLSNMEQKSFQYYTVHPGVVFSKRDIDYKIPYLDKQLTFNEFLVKISSNKYMILSPKLKIIIGEETKDVISGFIELTYSDGNIVKLQNQELDIQNISSDIKIIVDDDTYINVANKKIYYKDEEKINLGEITIESSDNIEIIESEEPEKIDDNKGENGNKEGESQNGEGDTPNKTIHKGDFEKVSDGKISAADIEMEAVVEENSKIKDPVVKITEFEVTANMLNIQLNVTDEAGVLVPNSTVCKVIKASTGEVVFSDHCSDQMEVLNLKPETNYIFVYNGEYQKNEMTYNKDFVQRTFVTRSLGVYVKKDYVKTDAANLLVSKKDFSKVRRFDYELVDNTSKLNVEQGDDVEFNGNSDFIPLNFTDLDSNHNYTLVIKNCVYDTIEIGDKGSYYYYSFNTLKATPTVDNTSFVIDQKNNKFTVQLNNVQDIDSGILEYKADVYEASGNKFVLTKTSKLDEKIEFTIDDKIIKRNVSGGYNVYVYLIFNNNDIEYEIPAGYKNVIINGVEGPTATINITELTWARMRGTITVKDPNGAIVPGQKIEVTYKSATYGNEVVATDLIDGNFSNGEMTFSFDKQGFKRNSTYEISLRTKVDYGDGNGGMTSDFQSFIVNTPAPTSFEANVNAQDNTSSNFAINVNFNDALNTDLEASAMNGIVFMIYNSSYDANTGLDNCIQSNGCWYTGYYDENNTGYNSNLVSSVYEPQLQFTNASFGLNNNSLPYDTYYFKILSGYDYTEYKNELPVIMLDNDGNEIQYLQFGISSTDSAINTYSPLYVETIYKSTDNSSTCNQQGNARLDDDTKVGFKVRANLSSQSAINRINSAVFHIYDENDDKYENNDVTVDVDSNTQNIVATFCLSPDGNLKRGKSYKFNFELNLKTGGEPEISNYSNAYTAERQEAKIMIYQKDMTVNGNQYENVKFYYTYDDVDGAVVDSKMYYYTNSNNNDFNNSFVLLSEDDHELIIPFTSGTLHAYVESAVLSRPRKIEYINYAFSGLKADIDNVDYYFITNNNLVNKFEIAFNNLTSTDAKRIAGVDITLKNNSTGNSITMYRGLNSDNKIEIDYADIIELKSNTEADASGKPVSATNMTIYYDKGIYTMVDGPLAIQRRDGDKSYILSSSDNRFAYNPPTIDLNSNSVELYAWDNGLNNVSLGQKSYSFNNGYVVLGSEFVNFKKLFTESISCDNNNDCNIGFSGIKPTIDFSRERAYVTTAEIRGSVSGVTENGTVSGKVYECPNNNCTNLDPTDTNTEPVTTISAALNDFNSGGFNITGLEPNTKYRIYYKWNDSDFYYVGGRNEYTEFETTSDVGISDISVSYVPGNSNDDRSLSITYSVGILEGYAGIKYGLYRKVNGEKVYVTSNIDLTTDSLSDILEGRSPGGTFTKTVNITGELESEKVYYIDIVPYYINGASDVDLDYETKRFSFVINEPVISIVRRVDVINSSFDVDIVLTDKDNALLGGGAYTYSGDTYDYVISQKNENDEYVDKAYGNIGDLVTLSNVACINDSCDLKITYKANFENTNTNLESHDYEYSLECSSGIITGNPTIAPTENANKIRIAFPDSYGITRVDRIGYTIYNSSSNIVDSNDNYSPVTWATISENNTIPYTEIPINFVADNDNYLIQLQLYYEDELIGNFSLDYIKG